jgi:hypothetical protein
LVTAGFTAPIGSTRQFGNFGSTGVVAMGDKGGIGRIYSVPLE